MSNIENTAVANSSEISNLANEMKKGIEKAAIIAKEQETLKEDLTSEIKSLSKSVHELSTAQRNFTMQNNSDEKDIENEIKSATDYGNHIRQIITGLSVNPKFAQIYCENHPEVLVKTRQALATYYHKQGESALAQKAINGTIKPEGGFFISDPTRLPMERAIYIESIMRKICSVKTISTREAKIPVSDSRLVAIRIHENETGPIESQTPNFRMITIGTQRSYIRLEMTQDWIEDTNNDIIKEIMDMATEAIVARDDIDFLYGDGLEEPEGIMSPGNLSTSYNIYDTTKFTDGFTTAYLPGKIGYVPSGDPNSITADTLLTLQSNLPSKFRRKFIAMMNAATFNQLITLKDAQGRYLINSNNILTEGYNEKFKISDINVVINDRMPSPKPGNFPIIFGDFEAAYQIVDRMGIEMVNYPSTVNTPFRMNIGVSARSGGAVKNYQAIRFVKMEAYPS